MRSRRGSLVGIGDPAPIEVAGDSPGVLAIHGFGGTPVEVALVCDVARSIGLRARAPLLPGHGTHCRDLVKTGWSDWCRHVDAELRGLAARGPVVVAGLSLGSLLALHTALRHHDEVEGLVLMANAFWLASPFPALPLALADRLGLPDIWVPKAGADIADPAARRTHLTYDAQPIRSAIEVLRAGERLRRRLPEADWPMLILHGRHDRVCPASSAQRIATMVSSRHVEVVVLSRSRHIVTRDRDRESVRGHLRRFLESRRS